MVKLIYSIFQNGINNTIQLSEGSRQITHHKIITTIDMAQNDNTITGVLNGSTPANQKGKAIIGVTILMGRKNSGRAGK
jgi:hypothetical protein